MTKDEIIKALEQLAIDEIAVIKSWSDELGEPSGGDVLYYDGFYSGARHVICLLYTSPSPRDQRGSRMPSSA